jgi:O-acetyl-ADP-ribose deacetylase (regulator of RNase III)
MNVLIVEGSVLESKAQTLVNTVNCVGIMGKGLALAFKKRYPEMYRDYVNRCARGEVKLGQPYVYRPADDLFAKSPVQWILLFPTKDHWRSKSKITDITAGLDYLSAHYVEWGITDLAIPPLGCGLGGLTWSEVKPILVASLEKLDIRVTICVPSRQPEDDGLGLHSPAL